MKHFINLGFRLLAIILFISCFSCEPGEDALVLSRRLKLQPASFINNEIELNWNEPYVPGFQRYLVFRSETKPGPLEKRNTCYQTANGLVCTDEYYLSGSIASISDQEETTYTDDEILITDKLYYRVVAVGDSAIVSNDIIVEVADVEKLDFSPREVIYIPDNNSLVFMHYDYSSNNINLVKYNLDKKAVTDDLSFGSSYSLNYSGLSKGFYNGKTELFAWYNNSALYIDPVEFKTKEKTTLNNVVYSMTSDNMGHVFVSESNGKIYSLERNAFIELGNYDVSYPGHLFFYQNRLLNADKSYSSRVDYFSINNGILSNRSTKYPNFSTLTGDFDEKQGILVDKSGSFYDFDMNKIGSISTPNSSSNVSYCFDNDSSLVYRTNFSEKEIEVYSLENFSFVRRISTLGWPLKVLLDKNGNKIVVSLTSRNSSSTAIIERL